MRVGKIALLVATTLTLLGIVDEAGAARIPECLIRLSDQPRFGDWPVPRERPRTPVPPVLSGAEARRFRSVLREGAAAGPNFAGHFTVVAWGCGASCTSAAIVDARTGRVAFPRLLRAISAVHVDGSDDGLNSLKFRLDSRLLVVLGAPDEDEDRDGATMLEWTGTALRTVQFIPRHEVCD